MHNTLLHTGEEECQMWASTPTSTNSPSKATAAAELKSTASEELSPYPSHLLTRLNSETLVEERPLPNHHLPPQRSRPRTHRYPALLRSYLRLVWMICIKKKQSKVLFIAPHSAQVALLGRLNHRVRACLFHVRKSLANNLLSRLPSLLWSKNHTSLLAFTFHIKMNMRLLPKRCICSLFL